MRLSSKFRLVLTHSVLFSVLAVLAYLGALGLYIEFLPRPLALAFSDLIYFVPMMGLGALILGILQAMLVLWLYYKKAFIFWSVQVVLALLFGGVVAFFSAWLIWVAVSLVNLFSVWILCLLIQRVLNNTTYHDMPS